MTSRRSRRGVIATGLALALSAARRPSPRAIARRPLMTLDPGADISDVYAFVSYDAANLARARPPSARRRSS